ncbi:protein adenylyltransferase SelO [Methylicorpusculum sp.]|uniref:protein adenylyltransferase SelO n=1 Tax=Methylicorpusculum sp. TaxID=2713644 RepID=UPI002730EDBE|nr:YdiU family protein [Methylicorpusculum sp.]MDP2178476.1 YdiU family protein [Methylicorpusculum sp.]MDP3528769.1 YdiU family protein [Methylicorpusculum sp.]MDZ4151864.1 YdiU family protein [Methylicorpusculum sp.]
MSPSRKIVHLDELLFDNRFLRELPADPEPLNTRRQVLNACYSIVQPVKTAKPQYVAHAQEVADLINLSEQLPLSEDFTQVFSGNRLTPGMEPHATCYGGHQFGNWAGQLGDGRAIYLGDVINHRGERLTLQLKGAGPTPYSRNADGLAVLRSSVREFLCSEAMHHLGIPTTRALSLLLTGDTVVRDMFYNGNPKPEPGAVVCRVAPSFTRFGHFQIFAARREIELLKQLVDYTIRTDFPHLGEPDRDTYIAWFKEVCLSTADLIVHWQRVGFVHGVMNTDNMSILGLTIDYGPYGWIDNYDPDWTPNTTDSEERRYRFGNQPQIAFWNLGQLGNAIYALIEEVEPLQEALSSYRDRFETSWQTMVAQKLGLIAYDQQTDDDLCLELFDLLKAIETDMSIFYRKLALISKNPNSEPENDINTLMEAYYLPEQLTAGYRTRLTRWLMNYRKRLQKDDLEDEQRRINMNAVNPKYVLRNYLAQQAIDKAEEGDFAMIHELLDLMRHPYDEQPGKEHFAVKRPDWARRKPGCSMLSCSS